MIAAVLRTATTDEAPAVAEVFLAARHSISPPIPRVHPDDSLLPWLRDIVFKQAEIWVAVKDGRIAAMMALKPGWVDQLHVHPDYHRQGLGTALLNTAKHSPQGAHGLELWTFQSNARARRFYEAHGFAVAELTDGSRNEERTPDVRYVWPGRGVA